MSYKIFISHAGIDAPIAETVKQNLSDAFSNNLELFLAQADISIAAEWKLELKSHLEDSNAIICILTADSINKPWLYIEWSPFWINSKTSFILHLGEISIDDLISPMQETQATNITDTTKVASLLNSLSKHSNVTISGSYSIEDFVAAIEEAQNKKLENSYGIHRKTIRKLPVSDLEKNKIARFFYENNEIDIFLKIVREIRNDSLKLDLIFEILNDGKLPALQELDVIGRIVETINSADKVGEAAIQLIKLRYLDSKVLREIIENLAHHNRAELRKIATHLIDTDQEETEVFNFICINMMGNFAEFRKIAEYLVAHNKYQKIIFSDLIEKFENYVELKKVGLFMLNQDLQREIQFEKIIKILSEKSSINYKALMRELLLKDPELYNIFCDKYGPVED